MEEQFQLAEAHPLLRRQLKKHLGIVEAIPAELLSFLKAVDSSYNDNESEGRRLERAIEISLRELCQANTELRGVLRALPDILFRIGSDGKVIDLRQTSSYQLKIFDNNLNADPGLDENGEFPKLVRSAVLKVRENKTTEMFEYTDIFEGETKHYEARLLPFLNDDIIGLVRDITPQKQAQYEQSVAEERVRWQAYHDGLTGLPNRTLFQLRLDEAVTKATLAGECVSVLFLDLDRFKNVNDTLGHTFGDELLQRVAERLQLFLTPDMLLARMGGDEFTVLIPNVTDTHVAQTLAQTLLATFEQPFILSEREVYVSGSVGVSSFPENGGDSLSLLRYADIAMYTVKRAGGGAAREYMRSMDFTFEDRVALETGLRRALERQEFVLFYQPQVDLATNKTVGVEALVRWNHPDLGLIPPGRFISVAEDTGLILRLSDWVMNEACRQAREWELRGHPVRVAVNACARQFEHLGLADDIADILRTTGLTPSLLDIELTESALISNSGMTSKTLDALRTLGVRTSLDDFGTGYSSLSYLRQLPVDMLKIDRSFVQELSEESRIDSLFQDTHLPHLFDCTQGETESSTANIIRAVIQVAHALNLVTLAEGVETEYQYRKLKSLGCDLMQGYLYSPPLSVEHLEDLLGFRANGRAKAA